METIKFIYLPNPLGFANKPFKLISEKKVLNSDKDGAIIIHPGDLLCSKWSNYLLGKYGKEHHLPPKEKYRYFHYLANIMDKNTFALVYVMHYEEQHSSENLFDYMKREGYCFVRPNRRLGIRVKPSRFDDLHMNQAFVEKLIAKVVKNYIRIRLKMHSIKCRLFIKQIEKKIIEQGINSLEKLDIHTMGGAMFYSGILNKNKVFIKGFDVLKMICQENVVNKRMSRRNKYNYPIWYESNEKRICIYEFIDAKTLKDINSSEINQFLVNKLELFLREVLEDFKDNNLLYGDLRPDNIMVKNENNRYIFKLCDLGWASDYKYNRTRYDIFYREMKKNLGDRYRFSSNMISDAASAYILMKQICGDKYSFNSEFFWNEFKSAYGD